MDVSVIFATYNRANILRDVFKAWEKVDKATKYEYEIICSDDASADGTVDIIKSVKNLPVKLIENEKGGAGKARNAALKIATGKIVIFTGDDMFPEENFINAHFENYLKYGENVATLGRIEWHEDIEMNHLMHHITNIGCEQFGFVAFSPQQYVDFRHFYTSNISVSKKLLDSLEKYFDTDFDKYGFEDVELGYRLQKKGMRIYYDPDIMIRHHHIYDAVEKFCNRQMSAGEELVVFNHMHDDLEDKCICDVDNCTECFHKYKAKKSGKKSFKGKIILSSMNIAKKVSVFLEKRIKKTGSERLKNSCSLVYAGIFRFYLYYGIATRIAEESGSNSSKEQIAEFAYLYMRKPFHQIYWDTGNGIVEAESRKWACWDHTESVISKDLPKGVKEIRVTPVKTKCKVTIEEMYLLTEDNKKVEPHIKWHNSCHIEGKNYDFTNTIDPQILIDEIPENTKKIIVRMCVKEMEEKSIYSMVRHAVGRIVHRARIKHEEKKEWNPLYAEGQERRIQIIVKSNKEIIEDYQKQVSVLGNSVNVTDVDNIKGGYTNYIYEPKSQPLDITQFLQVTYTLLNHVYDYVVVSKALTDFPIVAAKNLEDVLIYSDMLQYTDKESFLNHAEGRILRLPGYFVEDNHIDLRQEMPNIRLYNENDICMGNMDNKERFRISKRVFQYQKKKPMVFVVPIFLAVGGVERNTIEVMRVLKEKYDFCLITTERHAEKQGSLHYQLKDICTYIFDLKEIGEYTNYLDMLDELKTIFQPDVLWLCNNSPWFEENTLKIRKIFKDVVIIAQDVYDTKVGWIEYYDTEGPKTFDRYIAITELIRETFMNKYKIEDEKIDVIYPVIDDKNIRNVIAEEKPNVDICKKYDLNPNKMHFSFIARLTEQKNPIRYLELVRKISSKRSDIEFVMVGNGVLAEDVNKYISKHHMENNIKIIPYISNVPEFAKVLDGLILTSHYEGMPIVSIEAMCMKTPIFSTDVGDLKRFIDKNQNGVIVDEKLSDEENFEKFLDDLNIYKKNAEKCAAEILEFFSVEKISTQYEKSFQAGMKLYQ